MLRSTGKRRASYPRSAASPDGRRTCPGGIRPIFVPTVWPKSNGDYSTGRVPNRSSALVRLIRPAPIDAPAEPRPQRQVDGSAFPRPPGFMLRASYIGYQFSSEADYFLLNGLFYRFLCFLKFVLGKFLRLNVLLFEFQTANNRAGFSTIMVLI